MTADIRTAAEAEAAANVNFPLYHPSQRMPVDLTPFARSQFIEGAVWGAARVTPTREQVVAVAEKVIGEFPEYVLDPNKSWAQQEAEELADAVLALMQELAEGEIRR